LVLRRVEKAFVAHSALFSGEEFSWICENVQRLDDLLQPMGTPMDPRKVEKLRQRDLASFTEKWERVEQREDVRAFLCNEMDYPPLLREIGDPPQLLFVKGCFSFWHEVCQGRFSLGVVGSRKNTPYGRQVLETMVPDLVQMGICIVSGLAYGIDVLAHKVSLAAGGQAIGVLGCGVDVVYPPSHKKVFEAVCENGVLLSEHFPDTRPEKWFFPQRNRIVSGMSRGVLVVEAARKSGSLITARYALEQNREVFAVPGGIFSGQSQGTNWLIQQGAKLVTGAEDIREEFADALGMHPTTDAPGPEDVSPEERNVLQVLSLGENTFEGLCSQVGMQPSELNGLLTLLTLQGWIEQAGGKIVLLKEWNPDRT